MSEQIMLPESEVERQLEKKRERHRRQRDPSNGPKSGDRLQAMFTPLTTSEVDEHSRISTERHEDLADRIYQERKNGKYNEDPENN